MAAVAATGGQLLMKNIIPKHMDCITAKLMEMGVAVEEDDDTLLVRRSGPLQKANVKTLPYPGFPTDMQPQIAAVLCSGPGHQHCHRGRLRSNRFKLRGRAEASWAPTSRWTARWPSSRALTSSAGAPIQACDLRAGAALVIAGLAAQGTTELSCVQYIERGYEDLVGKLRAVGADIAMVDVPEESEAESHIS